MTRHRSARETARAIRYPVMLESTKGRISAGFTMPATSNPVDVAMRLRERGYDPYRIRLEDDGAWVATLIDWKKAA